MHFCKRTPSNRKRVTLDASLKYNELINLSCPDKKALVYSMKKSCRFDSTKQLDGPCVCRKLKVNKSLSSYYIQNGWYRKEPLITNNYKCTTVRRDRKKNAWIKSYIKNGTKDIRKRSEHLQKKFKSTSNFFTEMEERNNFTKLSKKQLYVKLKKINGDNKSKLRETVWFDHKTNEKASDIYKNMNKLKKKFKTIGKYQKFIASLIQMNKAVEIQGREDKTIMEVIKKDQNFIRKYNDSLYKFPLCEFEEKLKKNRINLILKENRV